MARYNTLIDLSRWLAPARLAARGDDVLAARPDEIESRGHGSPIDEGALRLLLTTRMAGHGNRPVAESDAAMSYAVRKSLAISRRDASYRGLWTLLNLTVGWPYVVWRWGGDSGVSRDRVSGGSDRSALARLWWMAELSHGMADDVPSSNDEWASRLRDLLARQDKAVQLYERPRLLSRRRLAPLLIPIAGRETMTEAAFREFASSCAGVLGVRIPAAMSPARLIELIERQADLAVRETR